MKNQREVFDAYYSRTYRFFRSRGFSEDQALDLTQETFTRVFQNMDKLRSWTSLESWILRVAANVWKNEIRHWRAKKREAEEVSLESSGSNGESLDLADLEAKDVPSQLEEALASERLVALRKCLEALPPRRGRCLVLHVFQDHKYQEIANLLHLSVQSVKSHIHQARRDLETCLARRLGEGWQ